MRNAAVRRPRAVRTVAACLLAACATFFPGTGQAQPEVMQFDVLLRLLPGDLAAAARLVVPANNGSREVRAGAGVFECLGDAPDDAQFSIQCYHRGMTEFVAYQNWLGKLGLRGKAFRDRFCQDVTAGRVNVPDRGYLITASGPRGPHGELPDSVTIYHFLQLPHATEASIGLPASEVTPGSPWLHHAGTCNAHVMWSERRSVAERR